MSERKYPVNDDHAREMIASCCWHALAWQRQCADAAGQPRFLYDGRPNTWARFMGSDLMRRRNDELLAALRHTVQAIGVDPDTVQPKPGHSISPDVGMLNTYNDAMAYGSEQLIGATLLGRVRIRLKDVLAARNDALIRASVDRDLECWMKAYPAWAELARLRREFAESLARLMRGVDYGHPRPQISWP